MALILNLKYVEGLEGLSDRVVKITFRENLQQSQIVRGRDDIYFGEQFEWPIGRHLDSFDAIDIRVFNFSKYLQNKMVGSLTISLAKLIEDGNMQFSENLIDLNCAVINTIVHFELTYYSPDSKIGDWRKDEPEDDDDGAFAGEGDSIMSDDRDFLVKEKNEDDTESSQDGASMAEGIAPAKKGIPLALDATMQIVNDFQVSVTVIEAKQLAGANINPCIEVLVGDKTKRTEIKMSTNAPYYNQYMCFDFKMSKAELLDQMIVIKAMAMGNMAISRLLAGDLIGEFRMDVKMVYEAPDHMFNQKWALLIDPKDISAGSKGYVKLDIHVVGKGEPPKHKSKTQVKKNIENEEEDIEANLLMPMSIRTSKRQMAEVSVKVYRAEDLPRMNTDIMASIKQAITGEVKPMVDPFVQVSFAGHTGKTKSKKRTYTPEWNEEVVFTEMFPPLCNRIRISVFDWDAVYNECIGTHFIELSDVMNEGDNGFLPTFGPSWVNLYGTPRNYTYEQIMRPKEELNRGLGEGVAFRGRMLVAIKTAIKSDAFGLKTGVRVHGAHPVPEFVAGKREEYFLAGVIYEASVIDQEIGNKNLPISFELSIGTTGNSLDGQFTDDDLDSSDEEEGQSRGVAIDSSGWCRSITNPILPATRDMEYYHVPFNERKPVLFMKCKYEDHRPRMFIPNIVERLRDKLDQEVEAVIAHMELERRGGHQRIRTVLKRFGEMLEESQNAIKSCRGTAAKTLLDKERHKMVRTHLEKMKLKVKAMRRDCTAKNYQLRVKEARALVKVLDEIVNEPQHSLPDVFIWMIMDKKRVAFARISARRIIHSAIAPETGRDSGKVVTIFLRKPGHKGMGQSGWALQGQLKMYLWLGLFNDKTFFKNGLPDGFDDRCLKGKILPKEIYYKDRSYFQFRAHMFMARNLIGSDDTGLSDAFARVIINDHVVSTKIIHVTLSPKWDQTLIVESMVFYFNKDIIHDNPPMAIVEIFDEDAPMVGNKKGKYEFLGRCFCKPTVMLDGTEYHPPKLDWWDIYRGQMAAGDLLAAFELVQIYPERGNRVANGAPSVADLQITDLDQNLANFGMTQTTGTLKTGGVEVAARGGPSSARTPLLSTGEETVGRDDDGLEAAQIFIVPVPKEIRPKLCGYRVELLFWGVREMRKIQLQSVERPKITVEFGGEHLYSDNMMQASMRPNFSNAVKYIDMQLPENELYWPPLMIQCEDFRQFGRTILVGTHVLPSVVKYVRKDKKEKKEAAEKKLLAIGETLDTQESSIMTPVDIHVEPDIQSGQDNLAFNLENFEGDGTQVMKLTDPSVKRSPSALTGKLTTPESKKDALSMKSHKGKDPSTKSRVVSFKDDLEMKPIIDGTDAKSLHEPATAEATVITVDKPLAAPLAAADSQSQAGAGGIVAAPLPGPGGENAPKAGAPIEIKKRMKIPKKDMEDIDWWTKFYVSIEDLQSHDAENLIIGVEQMEEEINVLGDIDIKKEKDKKGDDAGEVIDIPDEIEDPKEVKKRKKLKKKMERQRMKRRLAQLKKRIPLPFGPKDGAKEFSKEKSDELVFEANIHEDNSWIERLKIYPCSLESVKDFGGFEKFLKTFPLVKGKQEDDDDSPDSRVIGTFKGNLIMYKIPDEDFGEEIDPKNLVFHKDLPSNDPVPMLIRVYVIRGLDLHPTDPNGKADPYINIYLGDKQVACDKENYIPKQLNPVFGKCFEMEALFPQESMLKVEIMDWDLIGSDDLIGITKIDLENRYYSAHRALCGISPNYDCHGYNRWRDNCSPCVLLEKLCKDNKMDPPKYETVFKKITVQGVSFYVEPEIEDESGDIKQSNEPLALEVIKNWETIPGGCKLVPEHIETRSLFNPDKPGIEQGRLEMWIDMFPRELGLPPAAVDVTPRIPTSYVLRVIVWNTEDVILADDSMITGEKSSDIFIKGWMKGLGLDDQVTDVHYKSLSGEGNFNWRFIYEFDYLKSEDKLVYRTKESPFSIDETEIKAPCKLFLQVWDADIVSADDFLGSLELQLTKMPRGAKSSMACGLHQLAKDGSVPTLSIFRNKRCRGWWPFIAASEEDPKVMEVTGKLDAEFQLFSPQEAELTPAGYGRDNPNALPSPNRPDSSFLDLMNPLKSLKYLICTRFKRLLIKLMIISAFAALIVLFIYNSPGYIAKKMLGA